jgi:signal transduction histidine kinase
MLRILLCLFCLLHPNVWGSTPAMEEFFNATKNGNFETALLIANEESDETLSTHLTLLATMIAQSTEAPDYMLAQGDMANKKLVFLKYMIVGYHHKQMVSQNNLEAFKNFSAALKLAEGMGNTVFVKATLIGILNLYAQEIFIGSKQYAPYLEQFLRLRSDTMDEALSLLFQLIFLSKGDDDLENVDTQYYAQYQKLDSIFAQFPMTHAFYPNYYSEKGIYYKIEGNHDRAIDFFLRADSLAAQGKFKDRFRSGIAWQLAAVYLQRNELPEAKRYLHVFKKYGLKLRDSFYLNRLASLIFEKEGQHDSAYHYLQESVNVEYLLGYKNNTLETSILTVQNQTDKLKLDKLQLQSSSMANRNWAIGLGMLLLFGGLIGMLAQKNTRRKQLIAEQGKLLQEQKVATLLKEQELTTIDAMIQGQEKERQRVANELHDDLGGLMAAVKLQFNALAGKDKKGNLESFVKTELLIDEAYGKIRAIAHAKNSGLMAKKGLLQAVTQMAEKISVVDGVHISVLDYGLETRLENSVELTLFRIIQELITNVIKHTEATEVNIHITNHGESLNILVEDNGKGFEVKNMATNKGMGLRSIDKRIASLNGSLDIESAPGTGTVVIIDIPI